MKRPIPHISHRKFDRSSPGRFVRNFSAILSATLLVVGCTISTEGDSAADNPTYQAWKQVAHDSFRTVPPAPSFPFDNDFIEEEEASILDSEPDPLPQIPVSNLVLTREMDVAVLLRALADAADLNVIISSSVSGPVQVSLRRETSWDRLFLAITEARGYHYDLKDDLLSIFALKDIEDKIAMEQALHDQRQIAEKRLRSEPMEVAMIRIHYADLENLANSVRATMQSIVSDLDATTNTPVPVGGNIQNRFAIKADTDTGQLIIQGIPSDIARARRLIQGLDQPSYQILIEATIVQASNEVARQLGVQWGVFDSSSSGSSVGSTPNPDGFNSNFPAGFNPGDAGFIFGASRIRGTQVLQAQLSALQKDGRLNIVSRPSITTLDQLTATIESGEERPFASAAGSGVAAVSQIEFKKAVLSLEVTPHVIDKNWVKLDINTTKDEFDDTRSIVIDGNVQVPILTRSAITALYLSNGQTTVIGGLSSETKGRQEDGIPFLKDIPGLGGMFRSQSDRDSFSDTLIFITPHILPQLGSKVTYEGK